ncbi:MAG: DUF935 family protein [Spartobacteria bacterium]|nr:DUF935 family protein [Spartobacteria bacterium]
MAKSKPGKQTPMLELSRLVHNIQNRFDPLPNLTPAKVTQYHQMFDRGYVRHAALMWSAIEKVDMQIASVKSKRAKSVSRYGYKFITSEGEEDNPAAQTHIETLKNFYSSISCINGVDLNERGGMSLLIRQMMEAQGQRYAAHHIVYRPKPSGLTADFYYVPLWFFENTTGRLRFLESDVARHGVPLEPGEWMITVGEGLMRASSIAYMYKHLPLRDWLIYSQKHGAPGIHGITDAMAGSDEWIALETAVKNFGIDLAMVTNRGAEIKPIDTSANGELPYPKLIDYMDRAITILWRGGDLSTMSRADAVGASVQEEETDILEHDDASMITDTLNEQVDRWVIKYMHGVEPLAWISINTSQRQDTEQDIKTDQFLLDAGVPMSAEQLCERYGRTMPEPDEYLLGHPKDAAVGATTPAPSRTATPAAASNSKDVNEQLAGIRFDLEADAIPLFDIIAEGLMSIYKADFEPAKRDAELIKFRDSLDGLMDLAPNKATLKMLRESMLAELINGMLEGNAA